jgi:hypothetical protein
MGLYTTIVNNLATPFQTTVLGVDVTVEDIDVTGRNTIVAPCFAERSGRRSRYWIVPCRRHRRTALNVARRTGTGAR